MKTVVASIAMILAYCLPVFGQEGLATVDFATDSPTQLGVVYYFPSVPADSKPILAPLAQELATTKTSSKPFAAIKAYAELKGAKSELQLSAKIATEFFVRGIDPTRIKLYRADIKKKDRQVQLFRADPFGIHGKVKIQDSEIQLSIVELGDSRFKLVPCEPLTEGEYLFSPVDSNASFTFGVVASEK